MSSRIPRASWLAFSLLLLLFGARLAWASADASARQQDERSLWRMGYRLVASPSDSLPAQLYASARARSQAPNTKSDPRERAAAFLREHSLALFGRAVGIDQAGASELRRSRERKSSSGLHLWRRQFFDGIAVKGGWVCVHLDRGGRILAVDNHFKTGVEGLPSTPNLTAEQALSVARAAVDAEGNARVPETTELVLDPARRALVWKVTQALWAPLGDWISEVDAQSGRVLSTVNAMSDGKRLASAPRILDPPTLAPPYLSTGTVASASQGSGLVLVDNPLNGHPERYDLRDGDPMDGFRQDEVLERLDGSGLLRGDYVDAWSDYTTQPSEPTLIFDYSADLAKSPFHAVNAYWHIDVFQDYLQSTLGILDANNRPTRIFAHALEADNSMYSPVTDDIRFGDGGVDDAEDGEIVLHEYGHAIHENIVPDFTNSGETGAISEAFGDYVAATFGANALVGEWDATSYNPGPPPYLRRTDSTKIYPDDMVGEIHTDGEIISAVWWNLWNQLGKQITDKLVVESLFHIGPNAKFKDFANATLLVDESVYGGQHLAQIHAAYQERGIQPTYELNIVHTPLSDTDDMQGPYLVDAQVGHVKPLAQVDPVRLYWRASASDPWTIVVMQNQGSDLWRGEIPGPGHNARIDYVIAAKDSVGIEITAPAGGFTDFYSFNVALDDIPPTIQHDPVADTPIELWPPTISATVLDASGLSSVSVRAYRNGAFLENFDLQNQGNNLYAGSFQYPAFALAVGDSIAYLITAVDASVNRNTTLSGPYSFFVTATPRKVLVLDGEDPNAPASQKFDPSAKSPLPTSQVTGLSAQQLAGDLQAAGFVVTEEGALNSDPQSWQNYDLLVASFGQSTDPAADGNLRTNLVAWVQSGGKLLIEGGEIGFDAASNPGYPEFASEVLHVLRWEGDASGPLNSSGIDTPLRTSPNLLPTSLALDASSGYGDQDSMVPAADAFLLYGNAQEPGNAGVLVYDNDTSPASAQLVYWAFAYSQLSDATAAAHLAENTAHFLTTDQPAPNCSVSGTVSLIESSAVEGLRVWEEPSGISTTTDASGAYTLGPVYSGKHEIRVEGPEGYETASRALTLSDTESRTDFDFQLRPITIVKSCNDTTQVIPDGNSTGVTSVLTSTQSGEINSLRVWVDIDHPWRGDLQVLLRSPVGTEVVLHNRTGSDLDDIHALYPDSTRVDGPGSLSDFVGELAAGDWSLIVRDLAAGDEGQLVDWCLELTTAARKGVPVLISQLRAQQESSGTLVSWQVPAGILGSFQIARSVDSGPYRIRSHEPLVPVGGRISFLDDTRALQSGSALRYRIDWIDENGQLEADLAEVSLVLAATPASRFLLAQNYPNPFNPRTTIVFSLSREERTSLRIYDSSGRIVTTLRDELMSAGEHSVVWDGSDSSGRQVSAGTYFYVLRSGSRQTSKAMVLLK